MYKMCVVGNPVKQSKSPWIHQQFAKQFEVSVEYAIVESPLDDFPSVVHKLQNQALTGINITVPFKEEAFQLVDEVSERASQAQAVNTFLFHRTGKIYGDNTDGQGLVNDIVQNKQFVLTGKRILILGAGGAVRGLLAPLLKHQPEELMIGNRTVARAEKLVEDFIDLGNIKSCHYTELAGEAFDVMINATSVVSIAEQLPPGLTFSGQSLSYDLNYQATITPFLTWSQKQDAQHVANGWGMLVEQAALSFELWTGKSPQTEKLLMLAKSV